MDDNWRAMLQEVAEKLRICIESYGKNECDVPPYKLGGMTWDEMNSYWIYGAEKGIEILGKIESCLSRKD